MVTCGARKARIIGLDRRSFGGCIPRRAPGVTDLHEARLLRAARRGDPVAIATLWDRIVDDLWSIAHALLPEVAAVAALREVRADFGARLPGVPLDVPWRREVMGLLWRAVGARVEPSPLSGILDTNASSAPSIPDAGGPPPDAARARARVKAAVAAAPVELRMIYLFNLLGDLTAADMARLSGEPLELVRAARGAMSWRIVAAARG
ncbi:MAG: hypothetical protein H6739_15515 [Alphaproteobacteria bacterium]|nr:hypothetical protein [Alphaproteobacteria bacterium]